ncbi:VRR-NUC domain-containing protein [Marinimicrobium sp. ABcell2]|uniref:VRR-NUC domain-containing protein n=1 Tax=Marinimicrobium sp. ABcell2 TaxID=3069751 RepID=UPI0027AF7C31|nr:VRR-NUC domain-containing protein [Marinimicrobium sp. ABcell2]MDQ2077439.1 VRR-NUC domain-containing protein [Marinimicrobium sp. ABcell2]
MRISREEAIKRGWVSPEDVPPAPKTKKALPLKRGEIEGEEQACLVERFRYDFPDVGELLIHIPNGGSRKNAFEGWRLKRQGVRSGVSDLLLPVARGGYFGLWIEYKAQPPFNAAVTDSQKQWVALMQAQGYRASVQMGIEAAVDELKRYMSMAPTQVLRG